MTLSSEHYPSIRAIEVDRVRTKISYPHWETHLGKLCTSDRHAA